MTSAPHLATIFLVMLFSACTPLVQQLGEENVVAELKADVAVMEDGTALPLRVWKAKKPKAILVAVHGFNDYSNAFDAPAKWFAKRGLSTYAFDQRSFGKNPNRGIWAGSEAMTRDLATFVNLVKGRNPKLPVYVIGVSMGGAVAMAALGKGWLARTEGVVLVAPAVWGWRSMNLFYRASLWSAAHISPASTASGSGLNVWPSDNVEMLRKLGKDPLMVRDTRIDAIYGLVSLMDEAYDASSKITKPVLYLYGANDQIVPSDPTFKTMKAITSPKRIVYYKDGWHMLLRDKQAKRVWQDILVWIGNNTAKLPSGEEITKKLDASRIKPAARTDN